MSVRRVFHPGWFAWLAVTLCGLLTTGADARAGCGDHGRSVVFPIEASFDVAAIERSLTASEPIPPPTDPPRSCTGPSCSRQPAAPLAIPAPDRPPPDSGFDPSQALPRQFPADQPIITRPRAGYASPYADPLDRPPRP